MGINWVVRPPYSFTGDPPNAADILIFSNASSRAATSSGVSFTSAAPIFSAIRSGFLEPFLRRPHFHLVQRHGELPHFLKGSFVVKVTEPVTHFQHSAEALSRIPVSSVIAYALDTAGSYYLQESLGKHPDLDSVIIISAC